jgi:hypothetical protein
MKFINNIEFYSALEVYIYTDHLINSRGTSRLKYILNKESLYGIYRVMFEMFLVYFGSRPFRDADAQ